MVRLSNEKVQPLLVLLAALRASAQTQGRDTLDFALQDALSRWMQANPTNPLTQRLAELSIANNLSDVHYNNLIDELTEAVFHPGESKGDKPLIDEIVGLIGTDPYTSNRLNGETLSALRKALLRPSELEKFRQLAKESFSCTHCNHKFGNGEAAVVRRESDSVIVVRCLRCAGIQQLPCKHCGDATPIPSTAVRTIGDVVRDVDCGCQTRKKVDGPRPSRNREERIRQSLNDLARRSGTEQVVGTLTLPTGRFVQTIRGGGNDQTPRVFQDRVPRAAQTAIVEAMREARPTNNLQADSNWVTLDTFDEGL